MSIATLSINKSVPVKRDTTPPRGIRSRAHVQLLWNNYNPVKVTRGCCRFDRSKSDRHSGTATGDPTIVRCADERYSVRFDGVLGMQDVPTGWLLRKLLWSRRAWSVYPVDRPPTTRRV